MAKQYIVTLTAEEREMLQTMISSGTGRARKLTHARILLKADDGWQDQTISRALDVGIASVERVRKRFVLEGLVSALNPRPPKRASSRKLDGKQEARLIALTCGAPPEGHGRWGLRLLADQVVQLKIADSVSHETVRQVLTANELRPWRKEEWCIPPQASAQFVYHMEDVPGVYTRPADPKRTLLCFDESPEQLVSETRQPVAMTAGQPMRYDSEYRREGVANITRQLTQHGGNRVEAGKSPRAAFFPPAVRKEEIYGTPVSHFSAPVRILDSGVLPTCIGYTARIPPCRHGRKCIPRGARHPAG